MRRGSRVAVLLALAAPLAGVPSAQAQSDPDRCFGDLGAEGVPMLPGPPLRFGITPRVQAGQVGPNPAEAVPDDPPRSLAALERLRPPGKPLVLRLNRLFWSEEEQGIREFIALAERYTARGFGVELQLRYHPRPDQEGNVDAFTEYVREVVRRFGPNRKVVAIQVTNEVNFTVSRDSSDGGYQGAREALVRGVIAAKDEAERGGFDQLEIGFNWFYRTDPSSEAGFWRELRDRGGPAFAAAVDWVGLDAYPGTFFPPAEGPGEERDGMVNGMSTLRCLMATPGIGAEVPIHVEENGYPTGPGRSYETQETFLRNMIRAVHDFRGTYNVSDYRWFNLRDANTSSTNFQQQYGLLTDDYREKPAFGAYRDLIAELSTTAPLPAPRLGLGLRRLGTRPSGARFCAVRGVRLRLTGPDAASAASATFSVRRGPSAVDRRAPLRRALEVRPARRQRLLTASAAVKLADGQEIRLARRFRSCSKRAR